MTHIDWIKHYLKKTFGLYKLEEFESETIIKLLNENIDKCDFNYDYTIFKIKKYLTK